MKIFGIDPGSGRTGYGCIEVAGSRHLLVICGSLSAPARSTFPEKLHYIHAGLAALLGRLHALLHLPLGILAHRLHELVQRFAQLVHQALDFLVGGVVRERVHQLALQCA